MTVKVNGENLELDRAMNVDEFLIAAKAEQPEYVTVQKNGEFVERADFATTLVEDGDEIEFLYFMGGRAACN